ncbi:MAG: Bifunctional uridylyltransferase/uridylyl-removing enzyme [Actinomycetota bacterium]
MDLAATNAQFLSARSDLVAQRPTTESRAALVALHDAWLRDLAVHAGLDDINAAVVAVGGYGRAELCAGSDLDVMLLHHQDAPSAKVKEAADLIFYSIWDSGIKLDHSVRDLAQARKMAADDVKVALGVLDIRNVFGNEELVEQLRSRVLADWRAMANQRLPELFALSQTRRENIGELTHLLEPDLKEAYGGLRDVTILRAIAASWITDIDHQPVKSAAEHLMNVRDALHRITGKSSDRLMMQEQQQVADLLGFETDDELLKSVYFSGRAIVSATDLAWHRINRLTDKPKFLKRLGGNKQERTPLAHGVVVQDDEVVLARNADAVVDPVLPLRAAAAAAQAGLPLSPATVETLVRNSGPLPTPWSAEVRDALVSLLGSGKPAIRIWESLDNAGYFEKLFPHWDVIRAAPQRNALHIYTVDRHSIECAVQAAALARDVRRPDLLLVAALFHDIGKARGGDHCNKGAELMVDIAAHLGFNEEDSKILVRLVREHLLLAETATRRDLEDPATISAVAEAVGTHEILSLLHNLTIADSKATAPGIWNIWKERLVAELVARTDAVLAGDALPTSDGITADFPDDISETFIEVTTAETGVVIKVATKDRIGLLSAVAGVLSISRLEVRSSDVDTKDGIAYQVWKVVPQFGDAPESELIEHNIRRAIDDLDWVRERISQLQPTISRHRGYVPPPPRVKVIPQASERATVVEVRAHDAPALLHKVTDALAHRGVSILSAHVSTLGSEVVDALYLQNSQGNLLSEDEQTSVVADLLAAVTEPE